jgi:hypothetical protein
MDRGVVVVDAVADIVVADDIAVVAVAAEHGQNTAAAVPDVVMETSLTVHRTVDTVHHKDSPSRHPPRRPSSNTPGSADHTVDADIAVVVVVVVADETSSWSSSLALVSYSFRVIGLASSTS